MRLKYMTANISSHQCENSLILVNGPHSITFDQVRASLIEASIFYFMEGSWTKAWVYRARGILFLQYANCSQTKLDTSCYLKLVLSAKFSQKFCVSLLLKAFPLNFEPVSALTSRYLPHSCLCAWTIYMSWELIMSRWISVKFKSMAWKIGGNTD